MEPSHSVAPPQQPHEEPETNAPLPPVAEGVPIFGNTLICSKAAAASTGIWPAP